VKLRDCRAASKRMCRLLERTENVEPEMHHGKRER
jgi:hypothetical protein